MNTQVSWKSFATMAACTVVLAIATHPQKNHSQIPAPVPQTLVPTVAAPAPAQDDIVGTWQGTLHNASANRDLRIVDKIGKDANGKLYVMQYSIDQGAQGILADKSSFDGGILKYAITPFNGAYSGQMTADGKSITGTWLLGTVSQTLNLVRTTPDTAWPIPEPIRAMAAEADPAFDVVTIKPSTPGKPGKGEGFSGTHFKTFNTTLDDLIGYAYGVHSKQIEGAPNWFGTDLFDIDGVPNAPGRPNRKQSQAMIQRLLADRFDLKFHTLQKTLPVYVIRVANGGPKINTSKSAPNDPDVFVFRGLGDLIVRNMDIRGFASWMQMGVMDKPVLDQTGLAAKYDFDLKWTPDDSQFTQWRGTNLEPVSPTGDNADAPPSLYTAVQEQLGLRMEATKAPDDVIVIDHVERPSPN